MYIVANHNQPGRTERRLLDHLLRIDRLRDRRIAVHIHLSRLAAENRQDHNIRIAAHVFDHVVGQQEGEIFLLGNNDLFFIGEGLTKRQIARSVERLQALFSEDPLVYEARDGLNDFCTWYDLLVDYDDLVDWVRSLLEPVNELAKKRGLTRLDAKSLTSLEAILETADISNFVRNQTACAYVHGTLNPMFDELYVSIDDLQKTLLPENDVRGNRWLFQYLTEILDRRMLAHLALEEHRPHRVISINLNISSILSPEFRAYDRELSAREKSGNLVIEIQKHDIFADMGAFAFAQEFLHERSYKLCLDGMTHLTLPFIDREHLKLDLVKLCWSHELVHKRASLLNQLRQIVRNMGPERFIMVHCDTPEAFEIGAELGISLYQGRLVSSMLRKARRIAHPPGRVH